MLVNPYLFAAAGGDTDPFFSSVVALVHIEDSVVEVTGVTSVTLSSGTIPSATQAKFGTKSLICPNAGQNASGIRMQHAGTRFIFPGEFTMEAWFYPTAISGFKSLFDGQRDFPAAGSWTFQLGPLGGILPVINGDFSTGPSAPNGSLVINAWQHVAITRNASNVMRFWVGGIMVATGTNANNIGAQDTGVANLNVSRGIAGDNSSFVGFIEEVRVTKDVCRYTAAFDPPTAPFPDS